MRRSNLYVTVFIQYGWQAELEMMAQFAPASTRNDNKSTTDLKKLQILFYWIHYPRVN